MKTAAKTIFILVVGLGAAVIIYPFLHELGHSLGCLLVGAEIIDIDIFPVPNTLCDLSGVGFFGQVIIGLNGMTLPFALSMIKNPQSFGMWYVIFTIRWISLLSFIISGISIALYLRGTPFQNEDITKILQIAPQYAAEYAFILTVFILINILLIINSEAIQRISDYINKK